MMPIPHSGQIIRSSQVNGLEISTLNEPAFLQAVGELSESESLRREDVDVSIV